MIQGKENLFLSIPGLFISKGFVDEDYLKAVEEYIDAVPSASEDLKRCLYDNRMFYFSQNLKSIIEKLHSIRARYLQMEAERMLRLSGGENKLLCRKLLPPFITDMMSLSIALQMVLTGAQDDGEYSRSKIEIYADVISNLRAVSRLVEDGDFEQARSLLSDMDDIEDNDEKSMILENFTPVTAETAIILLQSLIEEYTKKMSGPDSSENRVLRKILAVDDRPEILSTLSDVLKGHYKVFAIPNGKTALKFLEKEQVELFILDIDMPEMNGYELAENIRIHGEYLNTPILFLTSNSSREHVINAIKSGGNDFIVKPVNRDMLLAKISHHLR